MSANDIIPGASPTPPSQGDDLSHMTPQQQEAAANVVRHQIDALYDTRAAQPVATSTPDTVTDVNPYERTHDQHPQPTADQWQQYHSAWQTYYQKYYEGYYTHHLTRAQESLKQTAAVPDGNYFAHQPIEPEEVSVTKDEALFDLRQKLRAQV